MSKYLKIYYQQLFQIRVWQNLFLSKVLYGMMISLDLNIILLYFFLIWWLGRTWKSQSDQSEEPEQIQNLNSDILFLLIFKIKKIFLKNFWKEIVWVWKTRTVFRFTVNNITGSNNLKFLGPPFEKKSYF